MRYGEHRHGHAPGAMPPSPVALATERRFDRADLLPAQVSPEGYLHVEGFVARPGVYVYRNADGSTRRELVPAKTLHDPASLATLARKPVTLDHAVDKNGWIFLDPSNVQALQVGDVDGFDTFEIADDGRVIVGMVIRRRDAIDAVRSGTHELSPQYDARMDPTPGVDPVFGAYDCVQIWRDYNAVAVVPTARGGRNLFLRADSADAVYDAPDPGATMIPKEPAEETPKADAVEPPAEIPKADAAPVVPPVEAPKADAAGGKCPTCGAAVAPKADAVEPPAEAPKADAAPCEEPEADAAPVPPAPDTARADAADFETRAIAYANERGELVELAKRLDVPHDGVTNAALRKAVACKARPGARADAADDYYRGIVDVVASNAGDPLSGLRFDGKITKRADAVDPTDAVVETAIARHAREAFEAAAPKVGA